MQEVLKSLAEEFRAKMEDASSMVAKAQDREAKRVVNVALMQTGSMDGEAKQQ